MPRQPKFTYVAIYEPDMERIVKALRVVLEYQQERKDQDTAALERTGTEGGEANCTLSLRNTPKALRNTRPDAKGTATPNT